MPKKPSSTKTKAPITLSDTVNASQDSGAIAQRCKYMGLNTEEAKLLKLKELSREETARLPLPAAVACIQIPYFDIGRGLTSFYRVRYTEETRKGFELTTKKPLRYAQPTGSLTELYLPPLIDWAVYAKDTKRPLIITEGEFKAICATKHGFACIGLGGVWSFQSKKNNQEMLGDFAAFEFNEREVFIVFDADATSNMDIVAAESRLSARLTDRGAIVKICRLPHVQELDAEGKKTGLDDYIHYRGAELFRTEVLKKALDYRPSATLHLLNEEVMYVDNPGFIYRMRDGLRMSAQAFTSHAYSDWSYTETQILGSGNTKLLTVRAAEAWLRWKPRLRVEGVTFAPGDSYPITKTNMLNTWRGWGLPEPRKGDVAQWHRLMDNIFGPRKKDKDADAARIWFERWCAAPLQKPGLKLQTAALIWGLQGSGKSTVGYTLKRIYGEKYSVELRDATMRDDRNQWAENKQFAMYDDVTANQNKEFMRSLMGRVTQKHIMLNPKNIPAYEVPDLINWFYTSNYANALHMDELDRRFFVWEVVGGLLTETAKYADWINSEAGACALWHYFLELDMGDFNPYAKAMITSSKSEMISLTRSELGRYVAGVAEGGERFMRRTGLRGDLATLQELYMPFNPSGTKTTTANALARELRNAGIPFAAKGASIKHPNGADRLYAVLNRDYWHIASYAKAREHYITSKPAGYFEALDKRMK